MNYTICDICQKNIATSKERMDINPVDYGKMYSLCRKCSQPVTTYIHEAVIAHQPPKINLLIKKRL